MLVNAVRASVHRVEVSRELLCLLKVINLDGLMVHEVLEHPLDVIGFYEGCNYGLVLLLALPLQF